MPASPTPALDENTLKTLESFLKFEQIQALIQEHLTSSLQKMTKIQACIQQQDWRELGRVAHDVISTSANFGMAAVLHTTRRLEAACLADNPNAVLAEATDLLILLPGQLSLLAKRYDIRDFKPPFA